MIAAGICFGYNSLNITANWTINFYKKILSPLQGKQICNFSPTCSQFYKQSINKYGIITGSLMGADRLMRCNPWAWTYRDKYYYGIANNSILDPPDRLSNIKYKISNINDETVITNNQQPMINYCITDSTLLFADYLYNQNDFTRAIAEYKRLLFFYYDSQNITRTYINLMLGESYLKLKDFEQSFLYFSLQDNPYFNYNRARVYFERGDYPKTREELDSVIDFGFNEQQIVLYGLSFYKEHNFVQGARFFDQHAPRGRSVINKLVNFDGHDIKKRNRVVSTSLSAVIPGLGQVYSGRWGDGIYSFLTVISSGLITNYYYHNDDSKIKFSIFLVLTAFFWTGNVYGANIAARDYNEYQIRNYLNNIELNLENIDLMPSYSNIYRK